MRNDDKNIFSVIKIIKTKVFKKNRNYTAEQKEKVYSDNDNGTCSDLYKN